MNTEKSNKLIAEFMPDEHFIDMGYSCRDNAILNYHNSWEWLMPVVKKIQKLNNNASLTWDMNEPLLNVDMKGIYKAVIEFINWYNKKEVKMAISEKRLLALEKLIDILEEQNADLLEACKRAMTYIDMNVARTERGHDLIMGRLRNVINKAKGG